MAGKKEWGKQLEGFLKVHQKKLLIIGIVILGVILLLGAFGLTLKLTFLLGNEIILHLKPEEVSLQMHYGDAQEVQFSLSATNFPTCTAYCSYSFIDKSQGKILDQGNGTLATGQSLERLYSISISRIGRGQDVYSFEVACKNKAEFLCLSSGNEFRVSSPLVVNYDLSEEEKRAKELARENFTIVLESLKNIDIEIKKLDERIGVLSPDVPLTDMLDEKAVLEEDFAKALLETERLRTLWSGESYLQLYTALNGSQMEKIQAMQHSLFALKEVMDTLVEEHNAAVGRILRIQEQFERDTEWALLAALEPAVEHKAEAARKAINASLVMFEGKMFANYSMLYSSIDGMETSAQEFGAVVRDVLLERFAETGFHIMKENDYICLLEGGACNITGSMSTVLAEYQAETPKPWWQLESTLDHCARLTALEKESNSTRNSTALPGVVFPNDADFNASAKALEAFLKDSIMVQYTNALPTIGNEKFANATMLLINIQNAPSVQDNLTLRQYLLTTLELDQATEHFKAKSCATPPSTPIFNISDEFFSARKIVEQPYEANSTINAVLSDNPPICCVFGNCKPCCTTQECASNPATFPIIFLHGHAFAKGSSAAYSLDAFTSIQAALEEEGYLKAGIVTPQTSGGVPGEWGLSGKPVTVKASYYFDAFRKEEGYIIVPTKSENIDTYALRLRDIITTVQEKTGKPQVVVVAHSMGGLVARRYMQIFGDDAVYKLVMIGTPNKGVVGRVRDYCPVFGEQKECLDMQEHSLFMNKLNDPSKQPEKAKLYTISGQGCTMDSKEGDGVVLIDHAIMQNAQNYNITGTCGGLFGEVLHTEMLSAAKYPEIVPILKKILIED
jgi:pimeloyl-ACP methyl ester carboxylesterase